MNASHVNTELWQVAEKDTRCRDVWQLSSLRLSALHAYKQLDQKGDIAINYPVMLYRRRGQVVIWYDASIPHEWVLDALRSEEVRWVREAKVERDNLVTQMERLIESKADDILPTFEAAAKKYRELQKMLEEEV